MILLPIIVLLPFVAAAGALFAGESRALRIGIIASTLVFVLTIVTVAIAYIFGFDSVNFSVPYISSLQIVFGFQFRSISLILTLMTAIVFFAASLVNGYFIRSSRLYTVLFLVAEGASMGVFLASNLFLLYVFWEVAEVMMFFIIFMYGGYERRYAAMKFIIFSLLSSLLLLIAIMLLYMGTSSFNITTVISQASTMPQKLQLEIMVLMLVAFMIKMPVFPLHTWLPDAHAEAPTPGSMILAGVLLKFGGYGLLLMFLMVPISHAYSLYMAVLFGFSAIYSGIVTFKQSNIKRLIAYTSITDMAIVGIGIAAANGLGTAGALYLMMGHAFAISLLFLIAGTLDEVYGTLEWSKISGVIRKFPALAYLFIIAVFAAIGLPFTSTFIGDLLVFLGSFNAFGFIGIVPIVGIFLVGAVLFWIVERVFLNQSKETEPYKLLEPSVVSTCLFLVACTVIFGVLPSLLVYASKL